MREELLKEYAEEALKNGPHRFIRPDDKIFYMDGFKDGYNLGLKAKINKTTISDAPAIPTKCNECGKFCTPSEMTDDRRMCKDCYIKWLEGSICRAYSRNRTDPERCLRRGALLNLDGWRKSDAQLTKAREIIQRITEWADWQGTGCPKFADIKSDAEEFLSKLKEEADDDSIHQ